MSTVYELTFFLGLGLLATVVAVFVLSVTQIGKNAESASEKQHEIMTEQKNLKLIQIERLQKQLDEARQIGQLDDDKLTSELADSQSEIEVYDIEIERLGERALLLERRGAVVWPGSFFLATIVLSMTATATVEINSTLSLALWAVSIFTLTFGIHRIFRTLGAIQEVTISQRESIDRLPEAVKTALLDIELSRKPEIELLFTGEQPPFRVACEEHTEIKFRIHLTKGEVARNIYIFLACPPGFTFPELELCQPPASELYTDYSSIVLEEDHLTFGVFFNYVIPIQASATPGNYSFIYMIACEGFTTKWVTFDVLVS